jgi:hypothetical protein
MILSKEKRKMKRHYEFLYRQEGMDGIQLSWLSLLMVSFKVFCFNKLSLSVYCGRTVNLTKLQWGRF